MKNLLYIGNNLKTKQSNISSIQVLGAFLEEEGYGVFYASSKTTKFFRLLDMLFSCFKYRRTVDFVLIDTYSTQNFYFAFVVSQCCRLLGLPYIPLLHGGNLERRLKQNPSLSYLIFNNAHALVSPSLFMKKVFESYGYTSLKFIPNPLFIENYSYHYQALKEIKLLWVRSFSRIYNPTLAVEVLCKLKLEGYSASLCMVGPDSDGTLEQVKALADELNVEVTFTGKLTKSAWTALAKDYTIFINTTNFDNMPVSVIEAMALGLPIVSTNVGGLPFLIEHEKDGLLVPANDARAFVNAAKRLFHQPVFTQSLAFNARKKVEQFDWNIIRFKWQEVLERDA